MPPIVQCLPERQKSTFLGRIASLPQLQKRCRYIVGLVGLKTNNDQEPPSATFIDPSLCCLRIKAVSNYFTLRCIRNRDHY